MVTDPISDMLTRIRNANMVKHRIVMLDFTKMSFAIATVLRSEGFIEDFETYVDNKQKYLLISLKYRGELQIPVIWKIKRISKPGLRIYSSSKQLPRILNNLGVAIISTSKGVMTNTKAKELGIGGEILCHVC